MSSFQTRPGPPVYNYFMPTASSQDPYTRRIGKGMAIAAWVMALALLTLFFNRYLDDQHNPNQKVHSSLDAGGVREVILQRNPFGHYVANGTINGKPVEFMVDTGASDVSIPATLAGDLGLKRGRRARYQTANGAVTAYQTVVAELTLGAITLRNVPASINPGADDLGILLGMSVLKRVEFTQRGDTLILRQVPG